MDAELLRSVTTLCAVILGFVLGQVAELFRTRRTSRKVSVATRAIVELEVEQNRAILSDYWHKVIASYDSWREEDGAVNYIRLARAVIKFPFPPIGKSVWLASLGNLASSYSPEALTELWVTHGAFDHLSVLHRQLEMLEQGSENVGRHAESRTDWPQGILSTIVGSAHFANGAEHLAREFEIKMRGALRQSFVDFP